MDSQEQQTLNALRDAIEAKMYNLALQKEGKVTKEDVKTLLQEELADLADGSNVVVEIDEAVPNKINLSISGPWADDLRERFPDGIGN